MVYPCTMGFAHLPFNLFYSDDYVNSGNVAMKCWFSRASRKPFNLFYSDDYVNSGNVAMKSWFSRASRKPYIAWSGRERNLFFNTRIGKLLYIIAWYTNSMRADGRFWRSSKILTRMVTVQLIPYIYIYIYIYSCLLWIQAHIIWYQHRIVVHPSGHITYKFSILPP